MSRESHRKYLENAALWEAQKAITRKGRESFSKDDLLHLRIQTVEPWKRIAVGLIGLLFSGISIAAFYSGPFWLGCVLAILAIGTILFAALGRRRPIDAAINAIDLAEISTTFFDGL